MGIVSYVLSSLLIVLLYGALLLIENESEDPFFWLKLRRRGGLILMLINIAIHCWNKLEDAIPLVAITLVMVVAIEVLEIKDPSLK